jgi:phosphopantothenoylcysteine synthetase/decarboxylase
MTAVVAQHEALAGVQMVVTAGGTQQPLDDVRFITNGSTGRFGARIAEECLRRGADVHYVHGRGAVVPFHPIMQIDVRAGRSAAMARLESLSFEVVPGELHCYEARTVDDLLSRLQQLLTGGRNAVIVHAMAVSDYTLQAQQGKISSDDDELTLRLERAPKVISYLKTWAPHIIQVGFKLLSHVTLEELYAAGYASGHTYNSDLTIANDLQQYTSEEHHPVLAIWPDGAHEYITHNASQRVVDLIEICLAQRSSSQQTDSDNRAAQAERGS